METVSGKIEIFNEFTTSVKWEVNDFLSLFRSGRGITSQSFLLENYQCQIAIQVIMKKHNEVPLFKVYTGSHFGKQSDKSKFNVAIQGNDGAIFTSEDGCFFCKLHVDQTMCSSRYRIFAPKDIFSKNGNLIVLCTIRRRQNSEKKLESISRNDVMREVSSQTVSIEAIDTLLENMKELLSSGRHADVTIKVGNKEYKAHKSVLAARSPVLDSMFAHEMLESNTGIVHISDTDEDTFQYFLTFLYTGKIDQVSLNKVKGLYEIADIYDLQELKRECVRRFMIEISVESVCDALRISTMHDEEMLLKTATEFFIDNAEGVFNSPNWSLFLKDHPEVANELFKKCFEARLK